MHQWWESLHSKGRSLGRVLCKTQPIKVNADTAKPLTSSHWITENHWLHSYGSWALGKWWVGHRWCHVTRRRPHTAHLLLVRISSQHTSELPSLCWSSLRDKSDVEIPWSPSWVPFLASDPWMPGLFLEIRCLFSSLQSALLQPQDLIANDRYSFRPHFLFQVATWLFIVVVVFAPFSDWRVWYFLYLLFLTKWSRFSYHSAPRLPIFLDDSVNKRRMKLGQGKQTLLVPTRGILERLFRVHLVWRATGSYFIVSPKCLTRGSPGTTWCILTNKNHKKRKKSKAMGSEHCCSNRFWLD